MAVRGPGNQHRRKNLRQAPDRKDVADLHAIQTGIAREYRYIGEDAAKHREGQSILQTQQPHEPRKHSLRFAASKMEDKPNFGKQIVATVVYSGSASRRIFIALAEL